MMTREEAIEELERLLSHWDDLENGKRSFRWYSKDAVEVAISALRPVSREQPTLTPPNEWVSVEDAVPDPGVRVLAANGSFVGEAYMASNGAWMRHDGFPWNVDCWMPMPDRRPPEGES